MASFSTAFGLCSITDSRGLLDVSKDDEGCAVVTLGKSMVIRCRLSDQKQLSSWSTALAKLTCKVVWNAIDENYVGVFDSSYIKQWTKNDGSLEKTKKHKFKNEIHDLLLYSKQNMLNKPQLIVLFKNGSIRDLETALSNTKEDMKGIIQPQETIELADIIIDNSNRYLIIVTKFENKYRQCYCVQLQEKSFLVSDSVKKIKLRRQGSSLLGFTILVGEKENSLLTFWSDGFLYSLSLPLESEKPEVGKYLGAINMISRKSEVSMQAVSGDRIAIYGADPSEEGAFLGIYNVKFGVIQAQTSFKMFNKPPRMWLIENNLVIVMGQRLVCVPFNLQTETLSALVGSRALHADLKTPSEICTIVSTAVWVPVMETSEKKQRLDYPDSIREQLETFSSEGWSEFGMSSLGYQDSEKFLALYFLLSVPSERLKSETLKSAAVFCDLRSEFLRQALTDLQTKYLTAGAILIYFECCCNPFLLLHKRICQALMTHLIEAKDISTLSWCLNNFTDIPEDHLVRMIRMAFREESNDSFKACVGEDLPEMDAKCEFVNKILTTPVDNLYLLKNLRKLLSFEDCLSLIKYLIELFSEDGRNGDVTVEESSNVLEWTMTLLDAFYQQLILSRDPKVLELMTLLKERIQEDVLYINNLRKIMPSLIRLKSGKGVERKAGHRKSYYVERFRLYE